MRYVSERIRFLGLIINGTLTLNNKSKKDLESYLAEESFMEHDKSYDYLTRMPIYNMTRDKLDELSAELEKVNEALRLLENTPAKDIWLAELSELEKILVHDIKVSDAKRASEASDVPIISKNAKTIKASKTVKVAADKTDKTTKTTKTTKTIKTKAK